MDPIKSSAATSVRRAGGAGVTAGTGVCRVTSASAVSTHMSDSLATSHRSLSAEERTSQMTNDAQHTHQASRNTRQPASAGAAQNSARRVVCGLWWGLGTILGAISALIGLTDSHFLQFLGAAAITALIGWYDYRIWTFKAKWLMFLIIF